VRRLPITIRLTLVFSVVMAVVLAATGLFLYVRLGAELDRAVEDGLRSRADDVAALVRQSDPPRTQPSDARLTDRDESLAQVIDAGGRIVVEAPSASERPVLTSAELARARRRTTIVDRRILPGFNQDPVRLLATPVDSRRGALVVVVGTSIDDRDEALRSLLAQMLLGGPAALLLATLSAFAVTRDALLPVEGMRRQAAAISGAQPGPRLPVPPTRDELSRLGETLNAMLVRLEAALAHERAFVADASHELRTPLAILKTELELAMHGDHSPEELEETIRSAAEETERLVRIAEDLLVLSSSEQGELPVISQPVDAHALLDRVLQRYATRAQDLGRRLEMDAPEGMTLMADQLRLEQAVGNMLDNALRHGDGGVMLAGSEHDGRIELHVLDEGPGFAPEFVGRAFERFSRADAARSGGGTGLGLAVVDGIAVAHGGEARASNRASGGADVWISVPRDGPPEQSPAGATLRRPALGASGLSAPLPVASRLSSVLQRAASRRTRTAGAVLAIALVGAAAVALVARGSRDIAPADRGRFHLAAVTIDPIAETKPVPHGGDAADDAAIWLHPVDPARSTIIGTDKKGGIAVYDLHGRELQYLADGRLNNVDLRPGFALGRRRVTLVAASNRKLDTVALYRVDERTRRLAAIGSFKTGIDVYGLCMYRSRGTRDVHVFVNSEGGRGTVEQYRVRARGDHVAARLVRSFDVGSQAEGCVADDALGDLYIGEEKRGIWKYGAEPTAGRTRSLVDSTGPDGHLRADVEGLALAEGPGGSGQLIASSQGDDTFAAYRRDAGNAYVGSFRIGAAGGIDDVEETDGIALTTAPLGARFPNGVLVAHDGRNAGDNQNFKLVPWRRLG
jgi:two-component system, OmpR family, sensor kinase